MLADAAANHRSWFGRAGDRFDHDGVTLYIGAGHAVLAFPRSDADVAAAVAQARDAGVAEASCWALGPDDALGERLRGLGFQDGWQPHWMGADPRVPREPPHHPIERSADCDPELPYASPGHRQMLAGDVHHLVAREGGLIVGHVVLNVDGSTGGVYDMGVLPSARGRGYGLALTLAALECARDSGCTSVTLNATGEGEPVYRRAGFESLGHGMTWWLFPRR
jgi:GNAT superfamily N-acetyltransferase